MAAASSNEVVMDIFPLMKAYKDGRVERLWAEDFVAASIDPQTGVQSKDVVIAPEINLSARLYLPKNATPGKKLPLIVYFHGGSFVVGSPFSSVYHKKLNSLVAEANVVAVSVDYRLAPEHPLPIAFEDSWRALKWVASQYKEKGHEEWIKQYSDSDRVFLGGDTCGGTIAHNLAMRVGSEKLDGINLHGILFDCPMFWGEQPIGNEETHEVYPKKLVDQIWHYVCPGTTGCDDPLVNPAKDPKLSSLGCKRLLVYVAEKDVLRGRGWFYKEALSKSGWDGDIEVVDVQGADHLFSVFSADGEHSKAMLKKVASFLNQ